MIDCLSECLAGLLPASESSSQSTRRSSRCQRTSSTRRPSPKRPGNIDGKNVFLSEEDSSHGLLQAELIRSEKIKQYTRDELMYKGIVQGGDNTKNNLKDNGANNFKPECVMCLEEFTDENPVMPTLCKCGENRALFHYPCVIQWKEKYDWCPSCKETLYYQEVES